MELNFSIHLPTVLPIDPVWIQKAELVRLETRDLGWFSKSIRLEDFVMERIARLSCCTITARGRRLTHEIRRLDVLRLKVWSVNPMLVNAILQTLVLTRPLRESEERK